MGNPGPRGPTGPQGSRGLFRSFLIISNLSMMITFKNASLNFRNIGILKQLGEYFCEQFLDCLKMCELLSVEMCSLTLQASSILAKHIPSTGGSLDPSPRFSLYVDRST